MKKLRTWGIHKQIDTATKASICDQLMVGDRFVCPMASPLLATISVIGDALDDRSFAENACFIVSIGLGLLISF